MNRSLISVATPLLLAAALVLTPLVSPEKALGGFPFISIVGVPRTDRGAPVQVSFWDLRGGRTSMVQVTNPNPTPQRIHVQVFNASEPECPEFDFFDDLTPFDTHVYDLSALTRNNGSPLAAPDLSGGHGILAVVAVEADDPDSFDSSGNLTGNFTVDDPAGYRYRTNSAGLFSPSLQQSPLLAYFNFSDLGNPASSDVVLVPLLRSGNGVFPIFSLLQVTLFDEDENPISCPDLFVGCSFGEFAFLGFENALDFGINELIGNSQGGPALCLGTDSTGFAELSVPFFNGPPLESAFVGFVGLNNNGDFGSMDSWYIVPQSPQ